MHKIARRNPAREKVSLARVLVDAVRFVVIFAIVSYAAFFLLQPLSAMNGFAASSTQFFTSALGKQSNFSVAADGLPHLRFEQGVLAVGAVDAEFNDLCAGKIELAVLLGIIVASEDRKWRARGLGFLLGAVLLFVFNPLRAAITLLFAGSAWLGIMHELFFRVSLILIIVVYYAAWYSWLSNKKCFSGELKSGS